MCDEHGHSGPVRYLLDNFDVSAHAEFSKLVPEHRSVESELSRSDRWYCHNGVHHPDWSLTLTRPCQFARLAFPVLKAERIRGTFLIPAS